MRLGNVIADWRFANGIGVREAGKLIGLNQATLNRVERGGNCDAQSLAKILCWLVNDGETRQPPRRRSKARSALREGGE